MDFEQTCTPYFAAHQSMKVSLRLVAANDMTYHLDWTVFLFAHTIAEVLDLGAFVLVFVGAVQTSAARISARAAHA